MVNSKIKIIIVVKLNPSSRKAIGLSQAPPQKKSFSNWDYTDNVAAAAVASETP